MRAGAARAVAVAAVLTLAASLAALLVLRGGGQSVTGHGSTPRTAGPGGQAGVLASGRPGAASPRAERVEIPRP